jgi:hypothetical protein
MKFKSMAKDLKGCVKEILGTAFSVGCTVNKVSPREVHDQINRGKHSSVCFCVCKCYVCTESKVSLWELQFHACMVWCVRVTVGHILYDAWFYCVPWLSHTFFFDVVYILYLSCRIRVSERILETLQFYVHDVDMNGTRRTCKSMHKQPSTPTLVFACVCTHEAAYMHNGMHQLTYSNTSMISHEDTLPQQKVVCEEETDGPIGATYRPAGYGCRVLTGFSVACTQARSPSPRSKRTARRSLVGLIKFFAQNIVTYFVPEVSLCMCACEAIVSILKHQYHQLQTVHVQPNCINVISCKFYMYRPTATVFTPPCLLRPRTEPH